MTGPESSRSKPLKIGEIAVANRVLLAPMSGVTDAPFRRLAATLGAGLVVSEMTASDELVHGRPMSLLRCETAGVGAHVVQLAGCEAHWMAEGARVAEAAGADIIDINMGCPARHVTGGQSGSALMRDLDHALELIEATIAAVKVPVTLKMRLGWDDRSLNAPELARRAEAGRRADDYRARAHALPVLQGRGRLGRRARGQGCGLRAARRQRRHHFIREGGPGAGSVRGGRRDDRARRAGPALAAGADRPPARNRTGGDGTVARRTTRACARPLRRSLQPLRPAHRAASTRENISAGRWRSRPSAAARRRRR